MGDKNSVALFLEVRQGVSSTDRQEDSDATGCGESETTTLEDCRRPRQYDE